MDTIIVIVGGIFAISFVAWFFLMKRERVVSATGGAISIVVDGGYAPETITIPRSVRTTLVFDRIDPSPCLETVVIPDFNIRTDLPLNQKTSVTITPDKAGRFRFSCGMNMVHGTIIVE